MRLSEFDPIVAIATPAGRSAIGVVRLSGAGVGDQLRSLLQGPLPAPRLACVRAIFDGDGALLDRGVVLWCPGPASYTGEDLVELQLHGNPLLLDGVVTRCVQLGARPAEAGEFTRRALLNGKLDLVGAEAVLATVEAGSLAGVRTAARVLDGALGRRVAAIRERLLAAAAVVEGAIDFPDDVGDDEVAAHVPELDTSASLLAAMASRVREAGQLVHGADVAILGPPNVGKSTLLNRILGEQRAIVDAEPGTTRDVVSGERFLAGQRVRFHDTAGLRDGAGSVEREGIRRAEQLRERAHVVLYVLDTSRPELGQPRDGDLVVLNKQDRVEAEQLRGIAGWPVSARTGAGIGDLLAELRDRLAVESTGEALLWTARQGAAAREAAERLTSASRLLRTAELGPAALEIADALRSLSDLLGVDPTEAVLDELFARFCVGK